MPRYDCKPHGFKNKYLVNKLDLLIRMLSDDYVQTEILIMHRLNAEFNYVKACLTFELFRTIRL